jgi:triosephosphate isomerase
MRDKIVAGNWKMNKTQEEAKVLVSEIANIYADEVSSNVKVVIAPPFVSLSAVGGLLPENSNVSLGAQNCNQNASGAYTGEISTSMLKSVGVSYVIIGHSERREYFKESDALLASKTDAVLAEGLTPIFCCGESLSIRESGDHFNFVCQQLTDGVFHLDEESFGKVVIAYEPIWAIGTGVTASPDQAQEMHEKLRAHISDKYGSTVADNCTILYGGSCNAQNAADLFSCPDVDGGLIGGASLKSRDFIEIIKAR